MGQFPICKLKWDLLRTSITACTIDKNTFSAPFGIFYVRTEIWKEIFQKIKNPHFIIIFSNKSYFFANKSISKWFQLSFEVHNLSVAQFSKKLKFSVIFYPKSLKFIKIELEKSTVHKNNAEFMQNFTSWRKNMVL